MVKGEFDAVLSPSAAPVRTLTRLCLQVGKTRADMERKLYRRHNRLPHQASREHLREVEKTLLKKHHTTWGWPIFTFWCAPTLDKSEQQHSPQSLYLRAGFSAWCAAREEHFASNVRLSCLG